MYLKSDLYKAKLYHYHSNSYYSSPNPYGTTWERLGDISCIQIIRFPQELFIYIRRESLEYNCFSMSWTTNAPTSVLVNSDDLVIVI